VTVREDWALWTCFCSSVWTLICDRPSVYIAVIVWGHRPKSINQSINLCWTNNATTKQTNKNVICVHTHTHTRARARVYFIYRPTDEDGVVPTGLTDSISPLLVVVHSASYNYPLGRTSSRAIVITPVRFINLKFTFNFLSISSNSSSHILQCCMRRFCVYIGLRVHLGRLQLRSWSSDAL